MRVTILIATIASCFIIASCSNENVKNDDSFSGKTDSLTSKIKNDSNDLHVFTLPAPLQVATLLKTMDMRYNEKMLVPSKRKLPMFSSNYIRALNLGIHTIDLSYATVYNQSQTAIDYAKNIQVMTQDLGLSSGVTKEIVVRFESNINRQDSLYKIILQSYNLAHQYFQSNKREEVGMYILAGSYLEGLYITLNFKELPSDNKLLNLIGQQKIFLENIIELLQYTEEKPETVELLQQLMALKKEFDPIKVQFLDTNDGRVAVKCDLTVQQLANLLAKTTELRNKLITP